MSAWLRREGEEVELHADSICAYVGLPEVQEEVEGHLPVPHNMGYHHQED